MKSGPTSRLDCGRAWWLFASQRKEEIKVGKFLAKAKKRQTHTVMRNVEIYSKHPATQHNGPNTAVNHSHPQQHPRLLSTWSRPCTGVSLLSMHIIDHEQQGRENTGATVRCCHWSDPLGATSLAFAAYCCPFFANHRCSLFKCSFLQSQLLWSTAAFLG